MHIYKIINIKNGKIYIGQSIRLDESYYGSGLLITRAIKKYGKEHFSREIIDYANSIEELCEKEKFWIAYYNSINRDIGYNITPGGEFGDTFTNHPDKEIIRDKMSKSAKKRATGKGNSFFGKTHSEETKKLIGEKNAKHAKVRAETYTEEQRKEKYTSLSMKGKKHSDSSRKLIAEKAKSRVRIKIVWSELLPESIVNEVVELYTVKLLGPKTIGDITKIGYKKVVKILNELNINLRTYNEYQQNRSSVGRNK